MKMCIYKMTKIELKCSNKHIVNFSLWAVVVSLLAFNSNSHSSNLLKFKVLFNKIVWNFLDFKKTKTFWYKDWKWPLKRNIDFWSFRVFKCAILGHFSFIFVFSTAIGKCVNYKILPMTGFKPQTYGIRSDHWATTVWRFMSVGSILSKFGSVANLIKPLWS